MSTEKGVKLDEGKPRLDLVLGDFADALYSVGEVGTYGANKYTDRGWQTVDNGFERYANAMLRHYLNFRREEIFDPESGLPHLAHMAWNALALLQLSICNTPKYRFFSKEPVDGVNYAPGSIVEIPSDHEDFRPIIANEEWEKLIHGSFKGEVKPEEETTCIYKPMNDICRCEFKME